MHMCMSCLNQYSESAQPDHRVLVQPVAQHMSSRTLVLLGTPEHCNPVQQICGMNQRHARFAGLD